MPDDVAAKQLQDLPGDRGDNRAWQQVPGRDLACGAEPEANQKSSALSTSEMPRAAIRAPTPVSTCPLPPARPDSAIVATSPGPTTAMSPALRSSDQGKPGRSACGTPQTEFSAFCSAPATPRAPSNVPTRPMPS